MGEFCEWQRCTLSQCKRRAGSMKRHCSPSPSDFCRWRCMRLLLHAATHQLLTCASGPPCLANTGCSPSVSAAVAGAAAAGGDGRAACCDAGTRRRKGTRSALPSMSTKTTPVNKPACKGQMAAKWLNEVRQELSTLSERCDQGLRTAKVATARVSAAGEPPIVLQASGRQALLAVSSSEAKITGI